jgi:hypothetical protein
MPRLRSLLATGVCALLGLMQPSCGTDAMGTDACRKIEQARCRKGPACPALQVQAGTGVEECTQFARDRCLHGLAVTDPGPAAVDQCVAAIAGAQTCDTVLSPETAPACAFLVPPQGADGGSDAAETSTTEASVGDAEAPAEGG